MPLPKPKSGEKEQDFISRCMSNSVMKEEFKDKDQRVAVCYSQFKKTNENSELNEIMNKYLRSSECRKCYHPKKGMGRITRVCERMNRERKDKTIIYADFGKGPEEVSKEEVLQLD